MIARLRRSLAYRLPRLYARLLDTFPPRPRPPKPPHPATLVTFTGPEGLALLRESLASLYAAWPRLPPVRVVSDGRLGAAEAQHVLAWWPGPLEVVSWREELESLGGHYDPSLLRFAEREVMGRKLAAILAGARRGPILYCDTDVLWFRDPARLDELLDPTGPPLLVPSLDMEREYDDRLVPGRLAELASSPPACAGFLFARGDLLAACPMDETLAFAAERGVGRTEQTIVAELARRTGDRRWPEEEVACTAGDRFSLAPTFRGRPWTARHYVAPARHLFWTDALALRLGRRRP